MDLRRIVVEGKNHIDKALLQDGESEMFPFFAAIALEFIARAIAANLHPALLAEPKDG